jgi:hypothetical protein
LENAVERACALSSGPVLHLGDLPTQLQRQGLAAYRAAAQAAEIGEPPMGRRLCLSRIWSARRSLEPFGL